MKAIGLLTKDILSSDLNTLYFESIDSTNTHAKENFESFQYPCLILTDHQGKGRGRNENIWTPTATGDSLYSTWCFKHVNPPSPVLSMRVGLCLYFALKQTLGLDVALKAPNDIYLNEKKLAGILIEGIHFKNDFYTFVGIGLNVKSAPLTTATFLEKHVELDDSAWDKFLHFLNRSLNTHVHLGQSSLTSEEQNQLHAALKKHSAFVDLKSISPDGDLIFSNKTINWSDL